MHHKVPQFQSSKAWANFQRLSTTVQFMSWGVPQRVFCGVLGQEVAGDGLEDFVGGRAIDGGFVRKSGSCCCPVGGLNTEVLTRWPMATQHFAALVKWVSTLPKCLPACPPWAPPSSPVRAPPLEAAWAAAWARAGPPRLSNRDELKLISARLVEERVDPGGPV